jgi:hypothetical protein
MDASALDPAGGLNFWPPAISALIAAVVLAVIVFIRMRSTNAKVKVPEQWNWLGRLLYEVNAPAAWSPTDSWTTNITAIGSVLGTAAGTTSALQAYVPNTGAFVAVSLLFGGAAVLAPVIYAALATSTGITDPGGTVSQALGTVGGLLLAAIFTLFGFFGEIFVTLDVAIHAVGGFLGPAAFWVSLGMAAFLVAIYAYRSLINMIVYAPEPTGEGQAAVRAPALSRLSSSRKASATL